MGDAVHSIVPVVGKTIYCITPYNSGQDCREKEITVANSLLRITAIVATLVTFTVSGVLAGSDIRTEKVYFKKGSSSSVVKGKIKGYAIVDYVLSARKGQYMKVSMATDNNANYFNIMAPGEKEVGFFNGSINQNQYEGILSADGEYKIRVYQMRSAARRNEVANYSLEIIITRAQDTRKLSASKASSKDAVVPGTDYHATGNIPCSVAKGQPLGSCPFGVTRQGNDSATVTVTKPDGRTRAIFFEKGKAVGADTSQADPGEFSVKREADLNVIHIGDERYEIPDAVITGG